MNEINSVKSCLAKTKGLAVIRFIGAALMLISFILLLIENEEFALTGLVRSDSGDRPNLFLVSLPFIILMGMGVFWGLAFFSSAEKENRANSLRIAAVVSQATSALGFIGCIVMMIRLASNLDSISGLSMSKAVAVCLLLFSIAGVITIPLTSIARTIYYNNVQKSIVSGTPLTGGAGFFSTMKTINGFYTIALTLFMLLFALDDVFRYDISAGVILELVLIVYLLITAVASLMEAVFVSKTKKASTLPPAQA